MDINLTSTNRSALLAKFLQLSKEDALSMMIKTYINLLQSGVASRLSFSIAMSINPSVICFDIEWSQIGTVIMHLMLMPLHEIKALIEPSLHPFLADPCKPAIAELTLPEKRLRDWLYNIIIVCGRVVNKHGGFTGVFPKELCQWGQLSLSLSGLRLSADEPLSKFYNICICMV